MVKLIIHSGDIHIRNVQRHEEYAEQLTKFIEKCKELAEPYEKEEVRIVICGDLIHQKNNITPELITFASAFIRELQEIAKVIVIAGNHDLIVNNTTRKDAITAIFETADFDNAILLDNMLDYKSGFLVDDNITWALYSIYNDYMKPSFYEIKENYPDNKVVGLYHGMIIGASLDNGSIVDCGYEGDAFEGCDCVMASHIHKRQVLKRGGIPIVYCGSLIQQDFGETVTNHGFSVWDMETMNHEFVDLESSYGMYKLEIKNFEDIDKDNETVLNY